MDQNLYDQLLTGTFYVVISTLPLWQVYLSQEDDFQCIFPLNFGAEDRISHLPEACHKAEDMQRCLLPVLYVEILLLWQTEHD